MKDYMTVKEIAEISGKSESYIKKVISIILPTKMKNGIKTEISLDELKLILNKMFSEKVANMLIENINNSLLPEDSMLLPGDSNLPSVEVAFNMALQTALLMKQAIDKQKEIAEKQNILIKLAQIQAKKQLSIEAPQYYTIKAWVSLHPEVGTSYNSLGREASKLSRKQHYDISNVYDEEYGSIGSYHIDILEQL